MAETKTKPKRAKSSSKAKSGSSTKTKATKSSARKTKARSNSSSRPKASGSNGSSNGIEHGAKAVRDAVTSAGKGAGQAASKAKIPLLAGGAAVAGTVGGIVLGASHSGDKMLGVKLPKSKRVKIRSRDLSKAAKQVGRFGENVGDLTSELKRARESLIDGEGKQNSPIEVLLKGLTARR